MSRFLGLDMIGIRLGDKLFNLLQIKKYFLLIDASTYTITLAKFALFCHLLLLNAYGLKF